MNKASEALISIAAIGNAVDTAQENVMESMKTLGHKCDVMQEYHLNVGSNDEVIQEFITNRDEIITEYENEGPKKIYKKLLGMCNWVIPHFKLLLKCIEDETINHQTIDNWGGSWLDAFFGVGAGSVLGRGTWDLTMMKRTISKTDKKKTRDAFSEEDRKVIHDLETAAENWKRTAQYDRADRKFFDKFIAFTRDTRTTTKMKNATKQLVDALEATRDMAKSHFGGDEAVQEGYSDYFASYHGGANPSSSGNRDAGNGLLLKTKTASMPSKGNGPTGSKPTGKAAQLKTIIKLNERELAEFEDELKRAEAGEKGLMHPSQLRSHIKFTKEKLEKNKAALAMLEGKNGGNE